MKGLTAGRKFLYAAVGMFVLVVSALGLMRPSAPEAHALSAAGGPSYVLFLPAIDQKNGGVNGGKLDISESGPFTEDFKVTLCLANAGGGGGTQCVSTPWASQASPAGTSQMSDAHNVPEYTAANANTWWSNWAGSANSGPWGNAGGSYATVQTRALPADEIITNVQLGVQFIEDNSANPTPGPACMQLIGGGYPTLPDTNWPSTAQVHPDSAEYTPLGGGMSTVADPSEFDYGSYPPGYAYGWTNDNCGDSGALSDTPNYFRIYMSAEQYNAAGVSNNVPPKFNVSQQATTGTDGAPLEITVRNTGGTAWVSDQSTVIAGSQQGPSCDGSGGTEPSPSDGAGAWCTVSLNNYSDVFQLQHISGSFTVGNTSAQYEQDSQRTCTVGAPACSNDQCSTKQLCQDPSTSGVCSTGSCSTLATCAEPVKLGGCGGVWKPGCASTWGNQIVCSTTGGDPNVEPGATTTFKLGSLTAPSATGTYTETWQMNQAGGLGHFGAPIPISILVVASTTSATGTIDVVSENALDASIPISAAWDLSGPVPGGFVCSSLDSISWNGTPCSGIAQTYSGLPADGSNYTLPDATTTVPHYIFGGIKPAGSQTLTPSLASTTFVILWTPDADMQVSPTTAGLSSSTPSQAVVVTNTGAPRSTLLWTTDVSTKSGGNWLIASPSGDVSNGGSSNGTGSATISYDASVVNGLADGTYDGTVVFNGKDQNDPKNIIASSTVTVTLTIDHTPQIGYSCISDACTQVSSGGVSASSCAAACGEQQFACVNNACKQVSSGGTTLPQCQSSCGGGGGSGGYSCIDDACTQVSSGGVSYSSCEDACGGGGGGGGNGNYGCVDNSCVLVPSGGVSYSSCTAACDIGGSGGGGGYSCVNNACKQVSSGGVSQPDCTASCGAPLPPPACDPSLTANPSSIVVPESSSLSYNCTNVDQCSISQGVGVVPASDTISVTPSMTTTYTLTCTRGSYATSSSATVTVQGSNLCEQNPNAAGCPGQ